MCYLVYSMLVSVSSCTCPLPSNTMEPRFVTCRHTHVHSRHREHRAAQRSHCKAATQLSTAPTRQHTIAHPYAAPRAFKNRSLLSTSLPPSSTRIDCAWPLAGPCLFHSYTACERNTAAHTHAYMHKMCEQKDSKVSLSYAVTKNKAGSRPSATAGYTHL